MVDMKKSITTYLHLMWVAQRPELAGKDRAAVAIFANNWLITSDFADEVAFRVDIPGRDKGWWILSYLPLEHRLTRVQAMAGVAAAEIVLSAVTDPVEQADIDLVHRHAATLGLSVKHIARLLAMRATATPVARIADRPPAHGVHALFDFHPAHEPGPGRQFDWDAEVFDGMVTDLAADPLENTG
jgi:hypothetical protein